MNGESDVSHCLSEYLGNCSGVVAAPAQSRRATRHRLVGWRKAEAPRGFPPSWYGLRLAEAACNLQPAVLGIGLGSRRQCRYLTGSTCDEMPCLSRERAALRATLANSSWRACIVSVGVQIDNAAIARCSRS